MVFQQDITLTVEASGSYFIDWGDGSGWDPDATAYQYSSQGTFYIKGNLKKWLPNHKSKFID